MTFDNDSKLPEPDPKGTLIEIALPTYNRLSCLKQCIASLSTSFANVPEHLRRPVKLSIWDGGSTDSTPDWVRANCHNFSFPVELVEAPGPVPFGERLVRFLSRSTADYLWYFSDDDVVLPECFGAVFLALDTNPGIGTVYLNYSSWNIDLSACLNPRMVSLTNRSVSAKVDNIGLLGQRAGFLPALILSCSYGNAVPIDKRLGQTALPFVVPYLVTAVTKGITIIEQPLIRQRNGNSAFGKPSATSSWFPLFVEEWGLVCDDCARLGLSRRFVRFLRAAPLRERNLSFRRIVGERLNDFYQPPNLFAICFSQYVYYPQFWLFVAPAFLIPICVLRKLRSLYRALRRSFSGLRV